jgi:hypothetical protein
VVVCCWQRYSLVHKACFAPDVSNDVVPHVDSTTMSLGGLGAGGWNEVWDEYSELL